MYNRATRLLPPPILSTATGEKFLYGAGVPAPWNSSLQNTNTTGGGTNNKEESTVNEDNEMALTDARLFATWPYEPRDFRIPLPPNKRVRPVMGPGHHNSATTSGSNHRPTISIRTSNDGPPRKPSRMSLSFKLDNKSK